MKLKTISLCSIILLFALISYCEAKNIKVLARFNFYGDEETMVGDFDDETNTVRDIAEAYRNWKGIGNRVLRVINHYGHQYEMDHIIRKSGIRDGQVVYVK